MKKVTKRPEWKQTTPRDQLVGIISAAQGHIDNILDGRATPLTPQRVEDLLLQAQEILKDMPPGKWA